MTLSPRFKDALKIALAMVIAYYVALSMDWGKPMWAAFAVAVISLSTIGQSIHKGVLRMLGTLLAAGFSITLIALFPQDRWWLMIGLSAFLGLCTYLMGGTKQAYLWNVAGFVSVIICMESIPATENAFELAVLRSLETGLGILCYSLITLLLWPTSTAGELNVAVRQLASTQHQLYLRYLERLEGDADSEDLYPVRMQEVQQLNAFKQALAGAQTDTHEVWEARRQWFQYQAYSQQIMEALARWRESFSEIQELDIKALIPNFRDLTEELDARFGQIERMLAGEAPERAPRASDLRLNIEAVRALSHFQKAALAESRTQLRRLQSLTGSLFETLADIKGFAPSNPHRAEPPAPPSGLVLDPDRVAAAVRVMAGLWLAYLVWIYVEVPGGVGLVIMVGSLGMALATHPQIPMHLLYKPASVSIALASLVCIFVMPRLSSFAELGSMIFAVTFAICYLFYHPQQAIGRSFGLVMFPTIMGISNEQTYSFLSVADTALMFPLVFALLAITAHIPASPQPEKAFLHLLRRFFRSCAYLASTLRWDPTQTPTRLDIWRRTYHAREIATLPQKISAWAQFIDTKPLTGTKSDQLQAVISDIQALAYRLQGMLEARAAPRSAEMTQELRSEIDTWRAGLQEIFRSLSADPDAADHTGFRSQLEAKLESLEARIEEVLNRADTVSVSAKEAESAYRLLGAHRGLSEAVIAFAKQAAAIDWPGLREARF